MNRPSPPAVVRENRTLLRRNGAVFTQPPEKALIASTVTRRHEPVVRLLLKWRTWMIKRSVLNNIYVDRERMLPPNPRK